MGKKNATYWIQSANLYHLIIYFSEQFIRLFPLIHSNNRTHGIQPTENNEARRQWDREISMLSRKMTKWKRKEVKRTSNCHKNESDGTRNAGHLKQHETVK